MNIHQSQEFILPGDRRHGFHLASLQTTILQNSGSQREPSALLGLERCPFFRTPPQEGGEKLRSHAPWHRHTALPEPEPDPASPTLGFSVPTTFTKWRGESLHPKSETYSAKEKGSGLLRDGNEAGAPCKSLRRRILCRYLPHE